jgi:hypothetical protein
VTRLVSEGELALGQGKVAEADTLFEEALTLDATSSGARRGKVRAATTRLGLTRSLVPEVASSEGAEGRLKELDGFDDVEEMNVKRAVRVPGRTELDAARGRLKPGDTYRVDIYLRNTSRKRKKNIKLENVNIRRFVNDKESLVEVPWNKDRSQAQAAPPGGHGDRPLGRRRVLLGPARAAALGRRRHLRESPALEMTDARY